MAMLSACQTISKGSADYFALVIVPNCSQAKEIVSLYRLSQGQTRLPIDTILFLDILVSKRGKGIRITTSQWLLHALLYTLRSDREWLSGLKTVVCEDLQLLDAVYEYSVSLFIHETQALPVRFIGLSYCLNDPTDLASWLHVSMQAMFSFRPRDREQSLTVSVAAFIIPHSGARFKAMSKPAYTAITEASRDGNVKLFVLSRSQCQNVAGDLIMQCAIDINTLGFLGQ
ncbi:hypothetical protein M422DRAFT_269629 [Sphaerobolus stellatus SS14]|uniref:Uncharacterized protein n=1 Tax=Sphaerobolus stellatus (strain SS14) TaxID=990650 RepID=A0A0C9THQ2_SPHS4|nr:hypothetical protein M422DRAFT_269629 [Sphaerobolus stellatus SS14]